VGMLNPDDLKSQEAVKFIAQSRGIGFEIFLITKTDFENVIKQYRTLKEEVETALTELERELATREPGEKKESRGRAEDMLEKVMTEAPITKIVAVILRHALEGRASDIHIEPEECRLDFAQSDSGGCRFQNKNSLHSKNRRNQSSPGRKIPFCH